jgi:REP element-mobilizing transposase RayT
MPRQPRLDTPGTLHHVIVRGIEKRRIVDDKIDRDNFVSRMGQIASETETVIYAWAVMTNHFLFRTGSTSISNLMRRLLIRYVVSFNRRYRRHGPLFLSEPASSP